MRNAERGFTLIEVLVALVVSSLLLAVILQGSTLAITRLHGDDDRRTAMLIGRYLILRGSVLDYGGGNGKGREGRLQWESDEHLVLANSQKLAGLMRIHVVVDGPDARPLYDRTTLRMKRLPSS